MVGRHHTHQDRDGTGGSTYVRSTYLLSCRTMYWVGSSSTVVYNYYVGINSLHIPARSHTEIGNSARTCAPAVRDALTRDTCQGQAGGARASARAHLPLQQPRHAAADSRASAVDSLVQAATRRPSDSEGRASIRPGDQRVRRTQCEHRSHMGTPPTNPPAPRSSGRACHTTRGRQVRHVRLWCGRAATIAAARGGRRDGGADEGLGDARTRQARCAASPRRTPRSGKPLARMGTL
jgi:hypothetical protein